MADRIDVVVFEGSGYQHKYVVYTDLLDKEEIMDIEGVDKCFDQYTKNRFEITLNPCFDAESVKESIRAAARAKLRTQDKPDPYRMIPLDEAQADEERRALVPIDNSNARAYAKSVLANWLNRLQPEQFGLGDVCIYQQRPYTHAIVVSSNGWASGHGYCALQGQHFAK